MKPVIHSIRHYVITAINLSCGTDAKQKRQSARNTNHRDSHVDTFPWRYLPAFQGSFLVITTRAEAGSNRFNLPVIHSYRPGCRLLPPGQSDYSKQFSY